MDNVNFRALTTSNGFAYTAYEWLQSSKKVFGDISDNLFISPKYICESRSDDREGIILPRLDNYNLLGFNLHGSDVDNYWYGQNKDYYGWNINES